MAALDKALSALQLNKASLDAAIGLEAEWSLVRSAYKRRALQTHPDKGGNKAEFRAVHGALEAFRTLKNRIPPPTSLFGEEFVPVDRGFNLPSYAHCEAASAEDVPGYKIMAAPSSKSTCVKSGEFIAKGELRIGSLDRLAGTYGRWRKLEHWRVPASIWTGFPSAGDAAATAAALEAMDGLVVIGFAALSSEAKNALVAHAMDAKNHAKLNKISKAKAEAKEAKEAEKAEAKQEAKEESKSLASKPSGLPKPGTEGITPNQLAGKVAVLTGVFDYGGGGGGMAKGKDGVKNWLEAHGAKVTSAVSKKTNYVVCGRLPGMDKVSKGKANGATLTTVDVLAEGLRANDVERATEVVPFETEGITFSAGYGGNGLAKRLASGEAPAAKRLKA